MNKKIFLALAFLSISYFMVGQTTTIFENTCDSLPENWSMVTGEQKTGYYFLTDGEYLESDSYDLSNYTNLVLTSNLRSYGGGENYPQCTIELSTDGGSTWSASEVVPNIQNNYTDYTWTLGTINSATVKFRWTKTSEGLRDLRINNVRLEGLMNTGSNLEPIISDITQMPTAVHSDDDVTITASVIDDNSVTSVTLNWGLASGSLTNSVTMNLTTGSTYSGIIPAQATGATVFYSITATDNEDASSTSTEASYNVTETIETTHLIISQYYEGVSQNKWIEITNMGEEAMDLSNYFICSWNNTSTPSDTARNTQPLSGTLNAGESILFQHSDAALPAYASGTGTKACYFNGNDPIAITKGNNKWGNRVDCLYANDEWGKDKSFYRKATVSTGNKDMSVLDGTGEWVEVAIEDVDNATNNQTEYLGVHIVSTSGTCEMASEDLLKAFINSNGQLVIENLSNQSARLVINDVTGKLVFNQNINQSVENINLNGLQNGVYIINIYNNDISKTIKIVKH